MHKQMLGNPKLNVTPIEDIKVGKNNIVVDSIQYGNQEMIMEKDVPVKMKDGAELYVNIFRPNKEGQFPVVMSADTYGKDNKPKITNMGPCGRLLELFQLQASLQKNLQIQDFGYRMIMSL